jgi:O-acetyl-ADP-ribose deacetylase (regulator of RNase III)
MGKLISFRIDRGSFQQGFPVTVQIADDNIEGIGHPAIAVSGFLPPQPELADCWRQWCEGYRQFSDSSRLSAPANQVTRLSGKDWGDFRQQAKELQRQLDSWYRVPIAEFGNVRDKLATIDPVESVRLLVQTDLPDLKALPWQLFFESWLDRYSQAEVSIAPLNYNPPVAVDVVRDRLRILAILGNDRGIDLEPDRQVLKNLPDAETCFLVCPSRQELNDRLWQQGWDILFFAGHSHSGGHDRRGEIGINNVDSLSIGELKHGLKQAIQRGLKLAIFNSCDGLALADDLAELQLPQTIVMREMVPDLVAQTFARDLLTSFASGTPLHLAVRQAREKLQPLESQFPCATWLPTICQHPATLPITWNALRRQTISPVISPTIPQNFRPDRWGKIAYQTQISETEITLEYSDITKIDTDAIVVFEDTYLSASSDGASILNSPDGKEIYSEIRRKLPRNIGQIIAASGGELLPEQIFHAIAFDAANPRSLDGKQLQELTHRCLEMATACGLTSIAFPAWWGELDPAIAAAAIVTATLNYTRTNRPLTRISIVLPEKTYPEKANRFYTQAIATIERSRDFHSRQDLLANLQQLYRQRQLPIAADIARRYSYELSRLWEDFLAEAIVEVADSIEIPLETLADPIPLETPPAEDSLIDAYTGFNPAIATLWEDLILSATPEDTAAIFDRIDGDIDTFATLNDRYELEIATTKAKLDKLKEILQGKIQELASQQETLHRHLIDTMVTDRKSIAGNSRTLRFQSHPKVEVLVETIDLPEEYRAEKLTYTANKKALKEAIERGEDIGNLARIDPNIKVKFS